jgi:hypothetical protein
MSIVSAASISAAAAAWGVSKVGPVTAELAGAVEAFLVADCCAKVEPAKRDTHINAESAQRSEERFLFAETDLIAVLP